MQWSESIVRRKIQSTQINPSYCYHSIDLHPILSTRIGKMCSLQRALPVHPGHGVADRAAGHQEDDHGAVRAEAPARRDDRPLQGLEPGHHADRQRAQALLPQALPDQQHQLLRPRLRGAHLGLRQRRDRPRPQRTVRLFELSAFFLAVTRNLHESPIFPMDRSRFNAF